MKTNQYSLEHSINTFFKSILFVTLIIVSMASSCKKSHVGEPAKSGLELLPIDTGGIQIPEFYNNSIEYGYFVYKPSGYEHL